MDRVELKRHFIKFIYEYILLIVVLVIGAVVWANIFQTALADYLAAGSWNSRSVWLGGAGTGFSPGNIDIFGFTIQYQFEGYSDYSFFYVHWGHNLLNGVMPYGDAFGHLEMDGITNNNGLYIFPPLTAVFYAIGILIPVDNWGIGLLITILGYLTALPVYGIARELSNNRHVGEAAALTYLLAPNVLYHTTFLWTNPAPFYFFFFSGFYMLTKGKRHTGTLLIVTAALFKQTAWFLGIPLVVFLLMKSRGPSEEYESSEKKPEPFPYLAVGFLIVSAISILAGAIYNHPAWWLVAVVGVIGFLYDRKAKVGVLAREYLDLWEFAISVIVVVIFAGVILLPFVIAQPQTILIHLRLAMGGFPLESFTKPPPYTSPIRFQVLPVMAGLPTLAELVDTLVFSGALLVLGVLVIAGLMFLEPKREGESKIYFRRLLFLTMLMMLWVNLMGPRGVYKYYFTLMAPFFSIFSSASMASSTEEEVGFSISMIWVPILFSLMILIPVRNVYLAYVLLILLIYIFVEQVGDLWHYLTAPGRWLRKRISPRMAFLTSRFIQLHDRAIAFIYPETQEELIDLDEPVGVEL
ncbi:MAG: hypothetical protein EAX95_08035 [Candidatus Thorarchaeota archaeon]|nr:hypothetical protein [Candidatus Thorarchaeota archaeon]